MFYNRLIYPSKNFILNKRLYHYVKIKGEYNDLYINTNKISFIKKINITTENNYVFLGYKDTILKKPNNKSIYHVYLENGNSFQINDDNIKYDNLEDIFNKNK